MCIANRCIFFGLNILNFHDEISKLVNSNLIKTQAENKLFWVRFLKYK